MKIEAFIPYLIASLVLVRLGFWVITAVRRTPSTPDPWESTVAEELQDPESLPICCRCFTPQTHSGWFCPECGAVVGPYPNYLPSVYPFSEGEVLRNGVSQRVETSPVIVVGYLLVSLVILPIAAPVYWYFLFRHLRQLRPGTEAIAGA